LISFILPFHSATFVDYRLSFYSWLPFARVIGCGFQLVLVDLNTRICFQIKINEIVEKNARIGNASYMAAPWRDKISVELPPWNIFIHPVHFNPDPDPIPRAKSIARRSKPEETSWLAKWNR
jgi:hypothetical protein